MLFSYNALALTLRGVALIVHRPSGSGLAGVFHYSKTWCGMLWHEMTCADLTKESDNPKVAA
jgi:hypothetical protein